MTKGNAEERRHETRNSHLVSASSVTDRWPAHCLTRLRLQAQQADSNDRWAGRGVPSLSAATMGGPDSHLSPTLHNHRVFSLVRFFSWRFIIMIFVCVCAEEERERERETWRIVIASEKDGNRVRFDPTGEIRSLNENRPSSRILFPLGLLFFFLLLLLLHLLFPPRFCCCQSLMAIVRFAGGDSKKAIRVDCHRHLRLVDPLFPVRHAEWDGNSWSE